MGWFGRVLREGWGLVGDFSRLGLFFQVFDMLFLFPKYILDLLIFVEHAIDADVGVMNDGVAALVVSLRIAGGMIVETVEGDILVQEHGIQGDDLFLAEVDQPFLECFEFMDSLLCRLGLTWWGWGRIGGAGLRVRGYRRGDHIG